MAAKCLHFCKSAPRLVVAHESCNLDQSCQTLPPYKVRDFVVSETTLLLLKEKIATKTCNLFNHVQVQNVSDQVGLSNSVAVTLPLAQNWIEAVQVYVKENYPELQCQVWHEEEQHCIVTRKTLSGAQQVIAGTISLGPVVQSLISTNPGLTLNKTYRVNPGLTLIGL